jgi:diguanylate cyclase (GGDEF)-like protein/PAS domain S-box-containing protein
LESSRLPWRLNRRADFIEGFSCALQRSAATVGAIAVTQESYPATDTTNERAADPGEGADDLHAHAQRLESALNNMSHGLLMFDSSARLVVFNDCYIQMYGLSPDVVKPGRSLREIIQHRWGAGLLLEDPEQYCEDILSRIRRKQSSILYVEVADGRTIRVAEQVLPDGGWVATHEDITERRRVEAKIAHLALHDVLTNLPNRALFRQWLQRALGELAPGERLAVLYLDLDNFKSINDTLGHPLGDQLLQAVAGRLRRSVRADDYVARLGGDEFAIIQAKIKRPSEAGRLATQIRDAIMAPYRLADHHVVVETSIGIALFPHDGVDSDRLLRSADMALYAAKAGGRGTDRFFEREMGARMTRRRALEIDLRAALKKGELELHYQPIVDLKHDKITSCEALLRWTHPSRGAVSPCEFVPIAEESGVILDLGEWVIRKACGDAVRWPNDVKVAVNISPIQLRRQDLAALIVKALDATGLPANRLEIEVTEAILIQETAATLAALHRLRELGVKIALDDFGTGYSSLSYLRKFPFDKIKIDKSFIGELSDESRSAAIVQAVTHLANALSMSTTAEGVETQQQRRIAEASGCSEIQGFLFSPARHPKDLAELLSPRNAKRAEGDVADGTAIATVWASGG